MIALLQKLKAAEVVAQLDHFEARSHLSHTDLHKHDKCVARLIAIGSPAVPLLVRRLAHIDPSDPAASVPMILRRMGDAAVPCLARAMHHKNCRIRRNAISLLGRIATPAAVCALDDDSVDLMDLDALHQAQLEARHTGQPEGTAQLLDASGRASSARSWLPGNDPLV